jgi:hypothetical protein
MVPSLTPPPAPLSLCLCHSLSSLTLRSSSTLRYTNLTRCYHRVWEQNDAGAAVFLAVRSPLSLSLSLCLSVSLPLSLCLSLSLSLSVSLSVSPFASCLFLSSLFVTAPLSSLPPQLVHACYSSGYAFVFDTDYSVYQVSPLGSTSSSRSFLSSG